MPPEKSDATYLWDILDAAEAVSIFVACKTFKDYESDRMLRGAVERHIEIMGEAARRLSPEFRNTQSHIPWNGIIGQRNVLAHDYGEIKHERLWRVAKELLSVLIQQLRPLLPPSPQS